MDFFLSREFMPAQDCHFIHPAADLKASFPSLKGKVSMVAEAKRKKRRWEEDLCGAFSQMYIMENFQLSFLS